jgi:hypothetical protein
VVIVNHEDSNREAPIHVASRTGNLNILRTLVSHGANMHLVDSAGRSCLHCAAMGGHTPCLAYLLDAGGDALIEERDHHGRTALHLAVKANKIEAVRLLLETAADVDAVTPDGQTCRQIARAGHFHTLARLLAEYETGNDDGGGGDSDAGPYGYNSSRCAPPLPLQHPTHTLTTSIPYYPFQRRGDALCQRSLPPAPAHVRVALLAQDAVRGRLEQVL